LDCLGSKIVVSLVRRLSIARDQSDKSRAIITLLEEERKRITSATSLGYSVTIARISFPCP
jgi:hypothetical protein